MSVEGLGEDLSILDDLFGVLLELGLSSELERCGDSGNGLKWQSLVLASVH